MKNIIKKICSLLALIMIILNSSLLTTLSMAIDEINTNATANVSNGKKEKVKIYTSYKRLTNRLPNELTITGILEKDTEDCALYENPVVYFEFPAEIEKVVVNDIKVLYDNELKLKDYAIEKNDAGNQVIKVSLEGKQTQYSTDGISQGTNIRIVANVIAKQDIKTGYENLTMVCNTATAAQGLLIVNATENAILNNVEPKKENGTIIYANGLMLNTRSSIGSNTLKDGDTIHSNEIINNQITITNTTNNPIENIKVLGYIPEGMTFVKYDEEAFGYWEDTYTFLTDDPETSDGSILWQDDDWQYPADETVKTKEFTIETLKSGESQTFNYETKVNKIDKEKELETKIEFQIKDKDATEYRNISTYTIKNNAKDAAFETRIRTYIDRGDNSETGSSKNNWVYNVIVKNISNETQNATVKINVPETLSIKNVEKIVDKGEEFSYKLENGVLTVNYEGIAANDYRAFGIEAEAVNVITDENCRYQIEYSATVEDSNKDITSSNLSVSKGGIPAVKITQTSETNGETLNGHDEIEYKFEIENIGYVREEDGGYSEYVFVTNIPKELEVTSITYNSNEVTKETIDSRTVYTIKPIDKYYTSDDLARINADDYLDEIRAKEVIILKNGEKSIVTVKAKVKSLVGQSDDIVIENVGAAGGKGIETKTSAIISNTLHNNENQTIIVNPDDKKDDDNSGITKPSDDDTEEQVKYYTIAGTSWLDSNENGRRDDGEEIVSGINVYLYDVTNKKFLTNSNNETLKTTTDSNGKYSFTKIPEGSYYTIFEYNSNEYGITEYQKVGVLETENNDTLEKDVRMFGEIKKVAMTDIINLKSSQTNIDIGLIENKDFDFSINQTIQKITVSNKKGTKEYNYNDKKIAKFEIHSKQFVGSTVVVEYKVKVTNVGDLAGNVYEILSEIPSKMEFHSELNSGWTKSLANSISNVSFANTTIKPGESIETTIVLSKTLDDKDAGTYTNIAKISTSESQRHTEDSNVNNDTDQTEVIIDVATGAKIAFRVIGGVIMGLLYIALMIYFIRRVVSKKGMFVIFGIIFMTSIFAFSPKEFAYDVSSTVAGLEAELNSSISDAIAETKIGTDTKINVVLVRDQNGANFFYKVNADGSMTPLAGGCGDPGSHFSMGHGCYTYKTGDPIYDDKGNITGYEEEKVEVACSADYEMVEVPMGLVSTSEAVVTVGTVTVSGDDIPPEGLELSWDEFGQNFSVEGNMPGSFSAKESSALWDGLASVVDRNNPASTSSKDIESALGAAGYKGSYTADQVKGTDGVTGLSVTLTRTVNVCVSASATWINTYQVEAQYHCPKCGAGYTNFQHVTDQQSTSANACTSISFSTTISFWPEELPKTLILYKIDADTKEELYTVENNQCKSEFKFLVKQKGTNSQWEVGVGEQITGLYAGTYEIYEIDTQYGYGIWDDNYDTSKGLKKIAEIDLPDDGQVIHNVIIENKKQFIDLSGYVWEDMLNGKDNARNDLFQNDQYDDKDKLVPGVKVILHDTVRNRELVTWTNENGEYHFGSRNEDLTYTDDTLRIADLDKYYIEFEYNGVKYRNVKLNPDVNVTNASRASEEVASGKSDEDSSVRQRFNERFSTISSGTQIDSNGESTGIVIDANGNVNSDKISYTKNGEHQSQINYGKNMTDANGNREAYGENIYHIKATTYKNLNLSDYLEGYIKKENTTIVHVNEIKNINLGVYSREQVDVAVDSDVARFVLNVNGYQHTYKYATLVNPDTQEEMDVKLKALKGKYYERQLHESTISYSATPEGVPNLYADITYKIYLQNKSNSLTAKIKELTLN